MSRDWRVGFARVMDRCDLGPDGRVSDWTPRYLAYVLAQGSSTPEEQMKADRERWPGGPMSGYILWISEQWRVWREERGIRPDEPLSDADHADFDAWLAARNPVEAAP